MGNEGNSWKVRQENGICFHGFQWGITVSALPSSEREYSTPLEQGKSGILDADNKFKNILISFSRIADGEGE